MRRRTGRPAASRLPVALILAALLLGAACTDDPEPTPVVPVPAGARESPAQRTLRVAIEQPDDLVPQRADEPAEQWLADALFDGLTRWDDALRPEPAAAVTWESDPTATRWTFHLRDGAQWHDGSPVVAQDFVRGWRRLLRDGRMAHLLFGVEGATASAPTPEGVPPAVRALDARTLEVRLTEPDADFPSVVAHPALAPLPPDADRADFAAMPNGNGPFAATERLSTGRFVRVRRFAEWRNGTAAARIDEVVFQSMDSETAYLAFQQGRIHVAPVPAGALEQALDRAPATVWRGERAALYLLGVDHTRPPFDQVAVRRALSLAINRAALAAAVAEGDAVAVTGLLPPSFSEWVPERCASCRQDAAAAAEGFTAAGVTTLTLSFNGDAGHEVVARRLREDLADVGVDLEFDVRPADAFFRAARAGELSLFRLGAQPDVPLAAAVLRPLLHSGAVPQGPDDLAGLRHNYGRYAAADVDALLDQARAQRSAPTRAATYRRAARLALERDQAVVPLFAFRHRLAVSAALQGFRPDALGGVDWARLRLASTAG